MSQRKCDEFLKPQHKSQDQFSVRDLADRVNRLFGNDDTYDLVKEKLVGVTVHYRPDMERYEHSNIRTLLFCLDRFADLDKKVSESIGIRWLDYVLGAWCHSCYDRPWKLAHSIYS